MRKEIKSKLLAKVQFGCLSLKEKFALDIWSGMVGASSNHLKISGIPRVNIRFECGFEAILSLVLERFVCWQVSLQLNQLLCMLELWRDCSHFCTSWNWVGIALGHICMLWFHQAHTIKMLASFPTLLNWCGIEQDWFWRMTCGM